ncbi:Ubiquitin-conjugating enzyme E2 2 [Hondaea fermentalgiana]|uniref:Ubiquitin-conjugating enzyme E2 2 n=1 Tax=Hondaea fermentalgiana TaxID=2315210 RepID=A0A2R5GJR9_9STRA|nr:Ubiquitin-conjugating enzyme E2 2 [Hondaea fermentalgiana]|eukprot:GBG28893.1 Ubiquitin-conjugating enzyme E2 2 [Hondaea fermentalgiana]
MTAESTTSAGSADPLSNASAALTTLRSYRAQNLKDYNIMVEYKMLKEEAPRGVYLLPAQDSLRMYYGVIFIEAGLYRGAVFRFRVELPRNYPANDALPSVTFVSRVFHPYVNPTSGDLSLRSGFPLWRTPNHTLTSVLEFTKRIFYLQDYNVEDATNIQAAQLWARNRNSFLTRVEGSVSLSIEKRFVNDTEATIRFSDHAPHHDMIRTEILRRGARRGARGTSASETTASVPASEENKGANNDASDEHASNHRPSPIPFPAEAETSDA